jgi:hypothetical protein
MPLSQHEEDEQQQLMLLLMMMLMMLCLNNIIFSMLEMHLTIDSFESSSTMNDDASSLTSEIGVSSSTVASSSSSASISSIELLNRGFINAFLWAKGSVSAALFLLASNWCAVHFLVLRVWHFDGSTRSPDSELCFVDALLALLGVAADTRTSLEYAAFWSFHAAEAFLAYTLIWCIFSDPGVLRPPLVKHSHHDHTCELCGAARLPVLRRTTVASVVTVSSGWITAAHGSVRTSARATTRRFSSTLRSRSRCCSFDSAVLWTRLAEIVIAVVGFQSFSITGTQALHALLIVVSASLYSGCAYSVLTLFLMQCELIYRDETTYEWLQRLRAERERDIVSVAPPNNWRNVRRFFGETWLELLNLHRAVPPRL